MWLWQAGCLCLGSHRLTQMPPQLPKMHGPPATLCLPAHQAKLLHCWHKVVPGINRVATVWPVATAMCICDMHFCTITLPEPAWLQCVRLGCCTCAQ